MTIHFLCQKILTNDPDSMVHFENRGVSLKSCLKGSKKKLLVLVLECLNLFYFISIEIYLFQHLYL
jgi:hypothetical protein